MTGLKPLKISYDIIICRFYNKKNELCSGAVANTDRGLKYLQERSGFNLEYNENKVYAPFSNIDSLEDKFGRLVNRMMRDNILVKVQE